MPSEQRAKQRGNPDKIRAHQFKPGQSGNPGGRPKGIFTQEVLKQLRKDKKLFKIVEAQIQSAVKGDCRAFIALRDTVDGKPAQGIEVGGPDGGPIVFKLERIGKK